MVNVPVSEVGPGAALTWAQWQRDVVTLWAAPLARPATLAKHRQAAALMAQVAATPAEFDLLAVSRLLAELSRTRQPSTVNSLLRCVRCQCRTLVEAGKLAADPFARRSWMLPIHIDELIEKKHIPLDELAKVFAQADSDCAPPPPAIGVPWGCKLWKAHRRRALLYTLAFTGARRNEVLMRPIADVDVRGETGVFLIRGQVKTAASRAVLALAEQPTTVLRAWIELLTSAAATHPTRWLFPQIRKPHQPWTSGSTNYRAAADLNMLGLRAGVRGLTPLALRHSWATHAEQVWGFSDSQIQRVLRHTSLRTQQRYKHADLPNLQAMAKRIDFRIVGVPEPDSGIPENRNLQPTASPTSTAPSTPPPKAASA